jgi:hypothetical protein
MDLAGADRLHRVLGDSLTADLLDFSDELYGAPREPGRLFVVGPDHDEPWHFVAHLAAEAERHHVDRLVPTWLRWTVPPGAPPHLAMSVDRLAAAARQETVLVVGSAKQPDALLERVSDARRRGALIMAVHDGDRDLDDLAQESVTVDSPLFDPAQHLVTAFAPRGPAQRRARSSVMGRLLRAGR